MMLSGANLRAVCAGQMDKAASSSQIKTNKCMSTQTRQNMVKSPTSTTLLGIIQFFLWQSNKEKSPNLHEDVLQDVP